MSEIITLYAYLNKSSLASENSFSVFQGLEKYILFPLILVKDTACLPPSSNLREKDIAYLLGFFSNLSNRFSTPLLLRIVSIVFVFELFYKSLIEL